MFVRRVICPFQGQRNGLHRDRRVSPDAISFVPVGDKNLSRRIAFVPVGDLSNPKHISRQNQFYTCNRIHASRLQKALSCDALSD